GVMGRFHFRLLKKRATSFSNGPAHFFYGLWVCGKGWGDSFFRVVCLNRMSLVALTMTARTLNSWKSMPEVGNAFPLSTPISSKATVPTAKNIFCFIFRIVAFDKAWAYGM